MYFGSKLIDKLGVAALGMGNYPPKCYPAPPLVIHFFGNLNKQILWCKNIVSL